MKANESGIKHIEVVILRISHKCGGKCMLCVPYSVYCSIRDWVQSVMHYSTFNDYISLYNLKLKWFQF